MRVRPERLAKNRSHLPMTGQRLKERERLNGAKSRGAERPTARKGATALFAFRRSDLRDFAPFGIQRRLEFSAVRDFAPLVSSRRSGFRAVIAGAVAVALLSPPVRAQSGGNGTIYVGTYAKKILVLTRPHLKIQSEERRV